MCPARRWNQRLPETSRSTSSSRRGPQGLPLIRYYTGRTVEIIHIGDLDDPDCDPPGGVDLVVDFRDLLRMTWQDAV
jgi:hypothetical protein